MTEIQTHDVPTYRPGDTIRLELELTDSNGVLEVGARFRVASSESVRSIYRSVKLDGETNAVAVIELELDENSPPGEYVCEYIALTDRLGNTSLIVSPGIEFRVEGVAGDRQGPELAGWRFA
jgi:hypothetical protein